MSNPFRPTETSSERELIPLSEVSSSLGIAGQALWARLERASIDVCRPPMGEPGETAIYRDDFERLKQMAEERVDSGAEDPHSTRAELFETVARLRQEVARLERERERLVKHLTLQEQVHSTSQQYIEKLEKRMRDLDTPAATNEPRKSRKAA